MYKWPIDKEQETNFLFPLQWKGEKQSQPCFIRYDVERKLLKIVDDENVVVHMINPLDVIGINVEIKLLQESDNEGEESKDLSRIKINDQNPISNDLMPVDNQAKAILNLYTYPKSIKSSSFFCSKSTTVTEPCADYKPGTGPRVAYPFSFPLAPTHDFESLNDLVQAIREVAHLKEPDTKKSYLVLINPASGTKEAEKHWKSIVQPMLEKEAGLSLTVHKTSFAGHATQLIREEGPDLIEKYTAIICIGGDGILYEVLQGLQERDDFEKVLELVALGILGCGTSNGLAKSITFDAKEHHSLLESTFLIARGQTLKIDLSRYQVSNKVYYSFLTFAWAMIADIDIDSEKLRCLGSLRLDLWGAFCAARMRRYRGRLSYLPTGDANSPIPNLDDSLPSNWKVIEDDIIILWASHVTHAAEATYNSPPSRMASGEFQIMLVHGKHVGRLSMASILLGLDSGSHVQNKDVKFIDCIAYRLEPLEAGSYNDLDGEVIESGPIQAQILPGALTIFGGKSQHV